MSKIPFLGNDKTARQRLDEIFSRKMLGAVFVGGSASKILETMLGMIASDPTSRLVGWGLSFLFFAVLFIYWERIERTAEEALSDE